MAAEDDPANQALFREINERVWEIDQGFGPADELDVLCECGRARCGHPFIAVPHEVYERVHGDLNRFIVAPEHANAELVLERYARFVIVTGKRRLPATT